MKHLFEENILKLKGPIVVLGASGFIGANLFKTLLKSRSDVYGVIQHRPAWRLSEIPEQNIIQTNLNIPFAFKDLIDQHDFKTVFDCVAYGAYSFQDEIQKIYETNFLRLTSVFEILKKNREIIYIHSGSSSEYGNQCEAPKENVMLTPNSHYSVTKASISNLIYYYGKHEKVPCLNLRLYSVYGPLEDSSRLIPNLLHKAINKTYPPFANPQISRDFVYIDDVCEAYILSALNIKPLLFGDSINIGSGEHTTLEKLAHLTQEIFQIPHSPTFGDFENRKWDCAMWYSNPESAQVHFQWTAKTSLKDGLLKTAQWIKNLPSYDQYLQTSKKYSLDTKNSISAIIACYKDNLAIPIMHKRLTSTFQSLKVDYEIIFVNDNSPDDTEDVIRNISEQDPHVIGISHSRNFGSQSAFRSGMEIATKNACVLLDGDLQDPPELIEQFLTKWKSGYDVVYGVRVKREAPFHMQFLYKLFYFIFNKFSYIHIPRDAGDFSLLDKKVVNCILNFPERDLFLRGIRAFVGFKQIGIAYHRPERMFGTTTNNFWKNIGWAKKGILSFSNVPLGIVSLVGSTLFFISILLILGEVFLKVFFPHLTPSGLTTVIVIIGFFGALNLFGLSILGDYISKIFEEVKHRPHFIRRAMIRRGNILNLHQNHQIHLSYDLEKSQSFTPPPHQTSANK